MTEHHDSKDTDSKDTPTTPQENASENAAPDTFDYVVDYWDDEGSASNDSSDAVIEALSATVDANATDPTDGDTDADGEPAADKSRETAPAHSNENAQVTVPDVVQVADHLDSSLQAEEDGEDAALAGSSIFRAYPMLSLHDVTVSDPKTKEHIWQHLTFRCEAGECYAIMVDAHDTRRHATLLALIGGFIAPSSGEIMTKTTPYEDMDAEQLRGHRLGMITPQFSLRGDLNAVENLTYVMNASGQTFMKPVKGLAQDLLVRTRFGENTKADESPRRRTRPGGCGQTQHRACLGHRPGLHHRRQPHRQSQRDRHQAGSQPAQGTGEHAGQAAHGDRRHRQRADRQAVRQHHRPALTLQATFPVKG